MKREIKFRIWNGREMEYNITAGKFGVFYVNPEKGDGLDPFDSASLTPNTSKYYDDTPVMQFTGLVDMNEKDIYEGDIIKTTGYVGFVAYDPQMAQYVIKWRTTNSNRYMSFNVTFSDGDIWKCDYMEVIGNIYENPELL